MYKVKIIYNLCFYIGCCSILNLQPDLNGNPFLRLLKFNLMEMVLQKRLGVEGGKAAQNIFITKLIQNFF
ncbi:hypothetical protein D3C87_787570 [compost metagenome]